MSKRVKKSTVAQSARGTNSEERASEAMDRLTSPLFRPFYGPDDSVGNTIYPNPMRIVSLDEAGPFFLIHNQGEHYKIYILVCVELLT